ncbi:acetylglutamate kinase [Campylobacter fetus]|uniref:Acetylglutamate kinase n=3 Tax=Campylobacter fetus TaxID=196 RepID=ARGB_CAMFF|nr:MULTISPECIES: acetylglutamate kinase [Campylobacter]A0RPV9.1 RecName: Full=Acetylglutamate kinase; AltName: Full=N-acetyl-L-glutamate 5-phosphotransferase; AltName: Full=NAG kinase; Short=NAGK [Campylobacter fetus subsp. fetus 82-40]OCS22104.1 acetylglutamate kinase [Campylobacter fetus subsp. venerealis cfvi97/532]OCS26688.1 acetylglutamate kinase [Campylobacter fetus subsp. venerealis cfvB10]OCS30519.1 acetylglutamate kinase [Campylobacter fetus subsp. venerealis LMG 6570 = CCUG 33900]OCS
MLKSIRTAEIILSALPYIQKFRDEIFVIKYGGAAQIDEKLKNNFARDIVLLQLVGIKAVIVHGGGKKINSFLERLNLKSEFIDGLRVTDKDAMEVVEMTLSGLINKEITSLLNKHGARAIGISGKDDNMLKAKSLDDGKYGFVGEITDVNENVILTIINDGLIPVIAPIAIGSEYETYNINADLCASAIASKLKARKVIFLSDIKGVLDKDEKLISKLNETSINELKNNGAISGGMIPKIDACLECIKSGVGAAHIIDGKIPHSLLLEIFTDEGIGSVIK